jgi:hypothetical protein
LLTACDYRLSNRGYRNSHRERADLKPADSTPAGFSLRAAFSSKPPGLFMKEFGGEPMNPAEKGRAALDEVAQVAGLFR